MNMRGKVFDNKNILPHVSELLPHKTSLSHKKIVFEVMLETVSFVLRLSFISIFKSFISKDNFKSGSIALGE